MNKLAEKMNQIYMYFLPSYLWSKQKEMMQYITQNIYFLIEYSANNCLFEGIQYGHSCSVAVDFNSTRFELENLKDSTRARKLCGLTYSSNSTTEGKNGGTWR